MNLSDIILLYKLSLPLKATYCDQMRKALVAFMRNCILSIGEKDCEIKRKLKKQPILANISLSSIDLQAIS